MRSGSPICIVSSEQFVSLTTAALEPPAELFKVDVDALCALSLILLKFIVSLSNSVKRYSNAAVLVEPFDESVAAFRDNMLNRSNSCVPELLTEYVLHCP
ncbi:hypothetical protein ACP70R_004386 [Stipagrostis hirtigluma subsp. patula]